MISQRITIIQFLIKYAPLVKNPPASAGDVRSAVLILGLGRAPGEGHGNPL